MERGIAKGEDPSVGGNEPVAVARPGRRHPNDRLVERRAAHGAEETGGSDGVSRNTHRGSGDGGSGPVLHRARDQASRGGGAWVHREGTWRPNRPDRKGQEGRDDDQRHDRVCGPDGHAAPGATEGS